MRFTTTLFFQPSDLQQPRVEIMKDLDTRTAPTYAQNLSSDADSADGIFILQTVATEPINKTIEVQFPSVTRLKNVDHAKADLATLDAMEKLPNPLETFHRRPLMGLRDRITYALAVKGQPAPGGGKPEVVYARPTISKGKPMPALAKKV